MYKKYNLLILLLTSFFSFNVYSSYIEESIQDHKNTFSEVALKIWHHAEMGYQEFKSSNLLANELEKEGFRITKNVAGYTYCIYSRIWLNRSRDRYSWRI